MVQRADLTPLELAEAALALANSRIVFEQQRYTRLQARFSYLAAYGELDCTCPETMADPFCPAHAP